MSTLDPGLPLPADDLDEEDVAAELEALALRRRRKLPRVTLVLSVALVGAGAFIGGAEAQKHLGSSPTSTTNGNAAASLASRFRNAAGVGGATFTGAGATVGTMRRVSGQPRTSTPSAASTPTRRGRSPAATSRWTRRFSIALQTPGRFALALMQMRTA